jgi:pSer/pThr/pTyr-binding forkhead associated (FHA) protein
MYDVIRDMMLLQMETSTAHVVDLPKEVHRVQREEREETGEFPMPDVPVARRTLAISPDDARVALIAALDAEPRIEIIRPDRTTQIHKLTGREVRIGRSGEADVVVDEKQASRIQVIVTPQGGAYYIRDIHSINGTLLNGERLQPGDLYPLHDGDQVQIGATILKFHAIHSSETDSSTVPHSQGSDDPPVAAKIAKA